MERLCPCIVNVEPRGKSRKRHVDSIVYKKLAISKVILLFLHRVNTSMAASV